MTTHIRAVSVLPRALPNHLFHANPVCKPVERVFQAGQTLFHQGDDANYVFELRSGVVRQTRSLETGERQVIGFHFPGDIVGIAPGGMHRAECTAITAGRALVHRADGLTSPERDPVLHARLLSATIHEFAHVQDQLVMMGRRSACAKVEAFLQFLVERTGVAKGTAIEVDIPMTRQDIADFLGLAIETVSRTFTELRLKGVIEMDDPHRLLVLQREALASVH